MKKVFIIPVLIFCFISCKKNTGTIPIENCINKNLQKKINIYQEFKQIENLLVEMDLLNEINKQGYIKIFDKLNTSDSDTLLLDNLTKFHTRISSVTKNKDVLIFTPTVITIFKCNRTFLDSIKDNKSNYLSYQAFLDELLEHGNFDDINMIRKLVNSIPKKDFSNIHFRIPLISLYSLVSEYYTIMP